MYTCNCDCNISGTTLKIFSLSKHERLRPSNLCEASPGSDGVAQFDQSAHGVLNCREFHNGKYPHYNLKSLSQSVTSHGRSIIGVRD